MLIEPFAAKLQAFIEQRFGVRVPIVRAKSEPAVPADAKPGVPAIVLAGYGFGDIYSGGTTVQNLVLEKFVRPGTNETFVVRFELSEHEWSGQCDAWRITISGAREDEREPLLEMFHRKHRDGHWGANPYCTIDFNGVNTDL